MGASPMLYTIGYATRSQSELIEALTAAGVEVLVDVREVPQSRKRGFSMIELHSSLAVAGIEYVHERGLGNPAEVRSLWKRGRLDEGRARYRKLLSNGRRESLKRLLDMCTTKATAIMCLEHHPSECHRSVIAELAEQRGPLKTVHL